VYIYGVSKIHGTTSEMSSSIAYNKNRLYQYKFENA
jgi:hypothetical protein